MRLIEGSFFFINVGVAYRVSSSGRSLEPSSSETQAVESSTCAELSAPENQECRGDVEWAFHVGKLQPWASEAYGNLTHLAGIHYMGASIHDYQRYFYCDSPGEVHCGLPPCECSSPPCDVCEIEETCGDLSAPENVECKTDVEWAFNIGKLQPWAAEVYGGTMELAGVHFSEASIEDFQHLFHCASPAQTSCGSPPCGRESCYLGNASSCYETSSRPYALAWAAQGKTFFDDWLFDAGATRTMGSVWYEEGQHAFDTGVIEAHDTHAILRTGNKTHGFYRDSVKIRTKERWTHFLTTMKFNHAPWGNGVWPAFWTNGQGRWPDSGEVDILEYANDESSKVSLHVGESNPCKLHPEEVNKCEPFPDRNKMDYDCYTWYRPDDPYLGCGPTHDKMYQAPRFWADNPGVVAMEWDDGFVKVFMIPEREIPGDLKNDRPQPNTWDRWLVSYYPFAASERREPGSCPRDPLTPQQIILNLELCGDWAGYTWVPDPQAPHFEEISQKLNNGTCEKSHYAGWDDCCTQLMLEDGMDEYLRDRAYFNISYVKVYKQW